MTMHRALPRRTVLRGVGATLALPFLDAMVPAFARKAHAAAAPNRMVFVYVPNGIVMPEWRPKTASPVAPLPAVLPRVLEPMIPHRSDISILSGLTHNGDAHSATARATTRAPGRAISPVSTRGRPTEPTSRRGSRPTRSPRATSAAKHRSPRWNLVASRGFSAATATAAIAAPTATASRGVRPRRRCRSKPAREPAVRAAVRRGGHRAGSGRSRPPAALRPQRPRRGPR